MKQFILPKFYFLLQEASQKSIDIDAQTVQNGYDEFVMLVYQEGAAATDKAAYRNSLVYTRVELASFTEVSGKKCVGLSAQSP